MLALCVSRPGLCAHDMGMTGVSDRFAFLMFGRMWHRGISWLVLPLLCHETRETHESPKGGIVIIRQPYRAERYRGRVARNRTKHHLRKLCSDRRLGREAHAQAQCNKVHQGLSADIEPLRAKAGPKLREVLDQLVVEGTPQLRLTQNDILMTKGLPRDLVTVAERVPLWHRDIYVFGPKSGHLAIRQVRSSQNKGNVQPAFANERDLLDRCALQDMHQNIGMVRVIGPYDFAKKTCRHRRQNPDVQTPDGAATRGSRGFDREIELQEEIAALFEEACSGGSNLHAGAVPFKERYTQEIFESPQAAADSGLRRAKHPGGAAKTQTLGDKQSLCDRDEVDDRKARLTLGSATMHLS